LARRTSRGGTGRGKREQSLFPKEGKHDEEMDKSLNRGRSETLYKREKKFTKGVRTAGWTLGSESKKKGKKGSRKRMAREEGWRSARRRKTSLKKKKRREV